MRNTSQVGLRLGFLFATSAHTALLTSLPTRRTLKFASLHIAMPTVDEDLSQFERDVRTLKIEYEQYFGGGRPRPPADTQWRVDTMVRRYNERTAELSFGQRFRFNNIAQTYAKYQEMWRKKIMQKEAGTQQHHFGAAAKAVEAERARKAALQQGAAEPAKIVAPPPLDFRAAEAAARSDAVKETAAAFALSFSNPEHEKEKVYTLYEKLIEARTETGERSTTPSLKEFERFVQQKTKDLRDKGGRDIEYSVSVELLAATFPPPLSAHPLPKFSANAYTCPLLSFEITGRHGCGD
jgi:hypothetical protein